jgi:hypothetical protein
MCPSTINAKDVAKLVFPPKPLLYPSSELQAEADRLIDLL